MKTHFEKSTSVIAGPIKRIPLPILLSNGGHPIRQSMMFLNAKHVDDLLETETITVYDH